MASEVQDGTMRYTHVYVPDAVLTQAPTVKAGVSSGEGAGVGTGDGGMRARERWREAGAMVYAENMVSHAFDKVIIVLCMTNAVSQSTILAVFEPHPPL